MHVRSPTLPLGQSSSYPSAYDATLLFPIARTEARKEIGLDNPAQLPFQGWDLWNAYEMSWLNTKGLPQIALLRVKVPCTSPNIIESKSFKLYLNGFNQARFESVKQVLDCLHIDLSQSAGAAVSVELIATTRFVDEKIQEFDGVDLDQQDLVIDEYAPNAALLSMATLDIEDPLYQAGRSELPDNVVRTGVVTEHVFSRLLKSNCPVTQQPDWGCLEISYTGQAIDHASLLKYIVSYRMHNGFHENCVERIFVDIMHRCQPLALAVYARYTRRGGLDINPWRGTAGMPEPSTARSARQ